MEGRIIDEHLEILWHLLENDELDVESFKNHAGGESGAGHLDDLELQGYIRIDGEKIELTDSGKTRSRKIVRCHRLAERLQSDVLGMDVEQAEAGACEFEHLLASELIESICILLGHPRQCPHGRPIPEGRCCREKKQEFHSAVIPLDSAKVGETYKVAYLNTASNSRMHKLIHFGLAPGSRVTLHQIHPAFVIRTENGQLALEKEIAHEICVWKNGT